MSTIKLAYLNFKQSMKHYISLIVSLAFTILIYLNFQNLLYSDAMGVLNDINQHNLRVIVQSISFVLGCFMFFFIWYSTNVFLSRRKKEIGIYIFMGLSNQRIGKLYMLETIMIGVTALIFGVGFGIITTQLFQMILMRISEISVKIHFQISAAPILISIILYAVIYMIFVFKGYIEIVRSSVLDMVSASRQNEYVRQNGNILLVKAILGVCILGIGYYLAIKEGGIEVFGNVLSAVVLVVIGVYMLFGGMIPLIFQKAAARKKFLYQRQRNLWINNMIFRIKKNYRTYAMVCVLMLCSVTALATSFAMKQRYDAIHLFRSTYTFQMISVKDHMEDQISDMIKKDNEIEYETKVQMLNLDPSYFGEKDQDASYGILSYSQVKQAAKAAGLDFDIKKIDDQEIVQVSKLYLLSIITEQTQKKVAIDGKKYLQVEKISEPYLGSLQEQDYYYMVSDKEYKRLAPLGQEVYLYNYKIKDIQHMKASQDELLKFAAAHQNEMGLIVSDPNSSDIEWIKVMYSLCIFIFMVFILASGSILFMKLYNDAFEEKERYNVLGKIGISEKVLKKSVRQELRFAYAAPFLIMMVSSYFSVHALAKMMQADLLGIQILSVAIILVFFYLCYRISFAIYLRNTGIVS